MKKVTIIQRILPHYRVAFFNGLRGRLKDKDISLNLIYGRSMGDEKLKGDELDIDWGKKINNKKISFGSISLYWQPCLKEAINSDLVIVEQANKNIINYLLIFSRTFLKFKLAFWGHGENRQADKMSFGNRFKSTFLKQCDWWFAYTEGVRNKLIKKGYPSNKITNVQNAIDTKNARTIYEEVTESEMTNAKNALNISSDNLAIFCGGIYKEKRIDFLLKACLLIKQKIPDFHIIFIGSGPDAHIISNASQEYKWIHYLGPKFSKEKTIFFKLSKVFLMPGLVGLAVLDSFAFETPMITTEYPYHSPEIEYLENGKNGIVAVDNVEGFAESVVKVLSDPVLQNNLIKECKIAYDKYTVEQMVDNFFEGIVDCLEKS